MNDKDLKDLKAIHDIIKDGVVNLSARGLHAIRWYPSGVHTRGTPECKGALTGLVLSEEGENAWRLASGEDLVLTIDVTFYPGASCPLDHDV